MVQDAEGKLAESVPDPSARHPALARRTFRGRLMTATAALAIGVLAAAGVVIYVGVSHALHLNLDEALVSIARAQVTDALDSADGRVHLDDAHPGDLPMPIGSGYEKFAQIEDATGRIIARTPNTLRGPVMRLNARAQAAARRGRATFGDVRRGDAVLRALYHPFRDRSGRWFVTVVAVPKGPMDRSLRSLLVVLALSMLAAGTAAAWAASRLATSLTRPLERIVEAAASVGQGTLAARIPRVSSEVEIRQLIRVLNDMLDRLQAAFGRQEQLIAAQDRFVADASHELRSPLSNLRGTMEVALRRERSGPEYRETLRISLGEVDRLVRLVNDLLLLTRADAGHLRCDRQPTELARLARESAAAHAATSDETGVRLRLEVSSPAWANVDSDRMRQVIDNLLDNAFRYAPPGTEVVIGIEAAKERAVLWVSDHGPGIPEGAASKVFDRFYRSDTSRARRSGGLGLGLSLAKAIVEAHGGSIVVDSPSSGGATVRVSLPSCRPPASAQEPSQTGSA